MFDIYYFIFCQRYICKYTIKREINEKICCLHKLCQLLKVKICHQNQHQQNSLKSRKFCSQFTSYMNQHLFILLCFIYAQIPNISRQREQNLKGCTNSLVTFHLSRQPFLYSYFPKSHKVSPLKRTAGFKLFTRQFETLHKNKLFRKEFFQ